MRRKNKLCLKCGDVVQGRSYSNALYCRDCLDAHPKYSKEYKQSHDRVRYLFSMVAGVAIALAFNELLSGGKKIC